jgi:hypothetical protein
MKNRCRQAASDRKGVEIRSVDFTVYPFHEADTVPVALVNRAMANAGNAMTMVRQHPS